MRGAPASAHSSSNRCFCTAVQPGPPNCWGQPKASQPFLPRILAQPCMSSPRQAQGVVHLVRNFRGQVGLNPGADFVAERLLFGGECEIHRACLLSVAFVARSFVFSCPGGDMDAGSRAGAQLAHRRARCLQCGHFGLQRLHTCLQRGIGLRRWCWRVAGGEGAESTGPHSRCAQRGSRAPGARGSSTTSGPPLSALRSLQLVQKGFDRGNVGKAVPALGVDAQLARRLRPAQHQQAQQCGGLVGHAHAALKVVFPARGAPAAAFKHQRALAAGCPAPLAPRHRSGCITGFAAGLLVAAGDHGIERQRVAVGHGAGLFHQRGEHAGFVGRSGGGGGVEGGGMAGIITGK
jgi:hypothetical protein